MTRRTKIAVWHGFYCARRAWAHMPHLPTAKRIIFALNIGVSAAVTWYGGDAQKQRRRGRNVEISIDNENAAG